MTFQPPQYTTYVGATLAQERIKNPPFVSRPNKKGKEISGNIPYEHHVGSWACTMLKNVFTQPNWVITPELHDPNSHKKPDFTIEKPDANSNLQVHAVYELKKVKGDRMEKALDQVITAIVETVDEKGNRGEGAFETFVVVQRGLDIGFFEYHNDVSNLDEEKIPHFRGCVSLTEDYEVGGQMKRVLAAKPNGLKKLYFDDEHLTSTDEVRDDAKDYETDCIFNLEQHAREIEFLFHHIATQNPRSSV